MIFCPNCGNKFKETDKFCSGCGTSRNLGNIISKEYTQLPAQSPNISIELTTSSQPLELDSKEILLEASLFVNGKLKYGFINLQGNWVVQAQFDRLQSFDDEGYCKAELNGKWGIINRQGNWIVQPMFDAVETFDDKDYCIAKLNEKWGFINRQGNWVLQPMFDAVETFDDKDFSDARLNEKWGFIDRQGNWVIQPVFEYVGTFDDKDYCKAGLNEKWGFINRQGNWVIQPQFESIEGFDKKEYCCASMNGKSGFINRQGNWIIQPNFVGRKWNTFYFPLPDYDERDYCYASLDGEKYGYINRHGSWMVKPMFDELNKFDEKDYCRAELNEKYGFINREGNWIISPRFNKQGWSTYVEDFDDNNLAIVNDEKYGLINRNGDWVVPLNYYMLERAKDTQYYKASLNNKFGYIDSNGNWIIQPLFDYVLKDFEGGDMLWNHEIQEWENVYFKTEYSYDSYFEEKNKLYLSENIPQKKLAAFLLRMKREFEDEIDTDDEIPKVYYDDTTFGKGDDGIFITENEDNEVRLYLAPYAGNSGIFYLSHVKKIEVIKNKLIIEDGEEILSFSFGATNENILLQIKSFFDEYFFTDEEEDLEEDGDEDPLGLRENKNSEKNDDPLGLRD
jgi:hypothetical protein